MSDTRDAFMAIDGAIGDFETALALAQKHGLSLVQYGGAHYALIRYASGKALWRHHLYPGNQRICMDRHMPVRAPFLKVPCEWSLMDVVRAAIKEMNE